MLQSENSSNNEANAGVRIVPILASVLDEKRITKIISVWRPETLFTTAAYTCSSRRAKPDRGHKNNVFELSTWRNAADFGVADFVLISTDKAVRPINVMGASKRVVNVASGNGRAESSTKFALHSFWKCARFVWISGAHVQPAINAGGPVTATHKTYNSL